MKKMTSLVATIATGNSAGLGAWSATVHVG
jgi:hypothetical protein